MSTTSLLEMGFPYITKRLYQSIETQASRETLLSIYLWWALYITGTIILVYYKDAFREKCFALYANILLITYRKQLSNHSYHNITSLSSWLLLSKFEQWIQAELTIFENTLSVFISSILRWWSIIILYLWTDYKLLLMFIPIISIYSIIEYKVSKPIEELGEQSRIINEQKTSNLAKYFSEFVVIKVRNKFHTENNNLQRIVDPLPYNAQKQSILSNLKYGSLWYLFNILEISLIVFLWYQLIMYHTYQISDIIFLTTYIWRFRSPLSNFVSSFSSFQSNIMKYTALQSFLYEPQGIINGVIPYRYHIGTIDIKNITFGYHSKKEIFTSFSLTISGGKTVALVWWSGSGKSTLVKLILRLYDPLQWSISIDNQILSQLDIHNYYHSIGYLTQEPAVFDGSILDNMMYGYPDNDQIGDITIDDTLLDMIREALDRAQCQFVKNLPEWLHTSIGERWIKLSWGEKQRLAIARIFLKNPHILIFDEPTASLDSITEHAITQSLNLLFKNKTVIMIAHRLQTIVHADNIVVLEHGKIVQQWTHSKLIAQEWLYKKLVDLQSWVLQTTHDNDDEISMEYKEE